MEQCYYYVAGFLLTLLSPLSRQQCQYIYEVKKSKILTISCRLGSNSFLLEIIDIATATVRVAADFSLLLSLIL